MAKVQLTMTGLNELFDDDIPLEVGLGTIQTIDLLMTKYNDINANDFCCYLIGILILYSKSSEEDFDLQIKDFAMAFKLNTAQLKKLESEAFSTLDFNVSIDFKSLKPLFDKYANKPGIKDFLSCLDKFDNKQLLTELYHQLSNELLPLELPDLMAKCTI